MGCFVDEKTAGIFQLRMPAPVIVCTMAGIQIPVEIHGEDFAQNSLFQKLLDFGHIRCEAIVEGNCNFFASPLLSIQNLLALLCVDGHGLFSDHIFAMLQGTDNIFVMIAVSGSNNYYVDFLFGQHFIKVCIYRQIYSQLIVSHLSPQWVAIAERNKLCHILIFLHQRPDEHTYAPYANSDDCIFFLH